MTPVVPRQRDAAPPVAPPVAPPTAPTRGSGLLRLHACGNANDAGDLAETDASRTVFDAWFNRLDAHLRWRGEPARAVHDELESHLIDRIRDLMLSGQPEQAAATQALAELGDPRVLAEQYRRFRTLPARRYLMNASMFLLTGAALGLSILAVSSHPSAPAFCPPDEASSSTVIREFKAVTIPDDGVQTVTLDTSKLALAPRSTAYNLRLDGVTRNLVLSAVAERASTPFSTSSSPEIKTSTFVPPSPFPAEFAEKRISVSVKDTPLEEVLQLIGANANLSPATAWPILENVGVSRDTPITLAMKEAPLDQVIDAVSAALTAASSTPFAARSDGATLEFAPVAHFDQRETTLVSYDLSNVNSVEAESLSQLIYTFVEPDGWRENGGTTAWLRFAGPKMFVQAPKRYHAHIQWFLSELQAD